MYDFLSRLQANNSKDWMDLHRKEYHRVRDFYIQWLDELNDLLASIDDDYFYTPGKKAINRINNNLMFFPNKPTYKDYFGAGLDQVSTQGDFYLEFGLKESMMGGGYWHLSTKTLKSIREAIDYNGSELTEILNKKSFQSMFGGLIEGPSLIKAPKGFSPDHIYIDLLKRKSFAVVHYVTPQQVASPDFKKKVIEVYKELLPFRRYLNKAVSV